MNDASVDWERVELVGRLLFTFSVFCLTTAALLASGRLLYPALWGGVLAASIYFGLTTVTRP